MEEWNRVVDTAEALRRGDMKSFGELMDRSHESCRDLYEISIEELDVLVGIFKSAGALGSRLTGAGFGGCTVSLVREEDVPGIIKKAADRYYSGYLKLQESDLSNLLFPCTIVNGADTWKKEQSS
jgi:galactokinase